MNSRNLSGRSGLWSRRPLGAFLWLAAVGLLVAVLVGSLVPGYIRLVPFDLPSNKHFLAYLSLGFVFVLALRANWWQAVLVAIGLAAIGFGVELLQDIIPKRYFRWVDVEANAKGAGLGALLGWVACHWFRRSA